MELRKGREEKTTVIPFILKDMFKDKREAVKRVHADPEYRKHINPEQIRNPEYWSADYVVVTNLKPVFVAHAVQNNLIKSKQVAWMDFGYCRSRESLGGSVKWQYAFTPGKIHLFTFCDFPPDGAIAEVVANNIVVVAGAAVIANRELWPVMAQLMNHASDELLKRNMVDDDQTLFLMASLYRPDLFELHRISDSDWQPVLRLFNDNAVKA
jgi:protein YibB